VIPVANDTDSGIRHSPPVPWLPASHRRWILRNAVAITAVVNLALNATIAWVSANGRSAIPLWATPIVGGPSTITDTLGTLFLLPLITCVLCTGAVWRDLRTGRLDQLRGLSQRHPLLAAMPATRLLRGVVFGVLCVVVLALPVTLLLVAIDLDHLSRGDFIAYKTSFAVALGAVITPVIAVRAMADRVTERPLS
jgi:hypothetical protein